MNTKKTKIRPQLEGEIAINARLLYDYVGHPMLPYESWLESIQRMTASRGYPSRFKLMIGTDGELALNTDLAMHHAGLASQNLMGLIALILISDGFTHAPSDDPDFTNKILSRYRILGISRGCIEANSLHAFLNVKEPYEHWIDRLKKKHEMVYMCDYMRVSLSNPPKFHKKDTGCGDVFFDHSFALKISAEEDTRRGNLIRNHLEYFRSFKESLNHQDE